jgi:putative addiction module CopG family antidote
MTVEIPSELQPFVDQVVRAGNYQSEADVVGEALRLLRARRQRIEDLRREVQPALDRLDRGEGIELDDQQLDAFFEDVQSRSRAQAAERELP